MPTETNKQSFVRTLREIAEFVESRQFDIEEIFEYQCPDSFLSLKDKQAAEEVEEVRA